MAMLVSKIPSYIHYVSPMFFSANGLKNLTTWLVLRTVVLSELLDHSVTEIVIPNKTLFVKKDRSLVSLPVFFIESIQRKAT